MKHTYKIRTRKEPSGSTFYQLTIPREWIEQTHATDIQFKNGEDNQLIVVPVTFDIPIEQQETIKPEIKPERTIDERMEDLFFGDGKEQTESDVESLYNIDTVNRKYRV